MDKNLLLVKKNIDELNSCSDPIVVGRDLVVRITICSLGNIKFGIIPVISNSLFIPRGDVGHQ